MASKFMTSFSLMTIFLISFLPSVSIIFNSDPQNLKCKYHTQWPQSSLCRSPCSIILLQQFLNSILISNPVMPQFLIILQSYLILPSPLAENVFQMHHYNCSFSTIFSLFMEVYTSILESMVYYFITLLNIT